MRQQHSKKSRSHHAHSKPAPGAQSQVPEAAPAAQIAEPEPPAQTPQEACARASELIVRNWPAIIKAQVAKAKDGSHLHARYLEEFAGLSGALGSPAATNDESLAALLLRKLQIGTADDESASSNTTPAP